MMRYVNRVIRFFYYLFNVLRYKHLDFSAIVLPSVRVEGKKYISIGQYSKVQRLGWLLAIPIDDEGTEITIGRNCAIGDFSHVVAVRKIQIGDYVLIANNVYIADNMHGFQNTEKPIIQQPVEFKATVSIGDGAWIGENVCIIAANVGKNSVIGANSVVTKDIPDYCVAAGTPAKVIKKFDPERGIWITNK